MVETVDAFVELLRDTREPPALEDLSALEVFPDELLFADKDSVVDELFVLELFLGLPVAVVELPLEAELVLVIVVELSLQSSRNEFIAEEASSPLTLLDLLTVMAPRPPSR